MTEWKKLKIEDLAAPGKYSLATGPFGSAIGSRFFREEGVPVVRGSNLSLDVGERLIDPGIVFVEESKAEEFPRSVARRGDLIFTCWGTIGQIGLVDERARFDRYIVSNKQMKLTPDPGRVDSLFLYYALSSPGAVAQVQGASIGSSVPGFNLTQLRKVEVLCPPLAHQQSIAKMLGALDDKIAVNERIAATYERLLQCRFVELGLGDDPDGDSVIPITDLITFGPKLGKPVAAEPVYVDMAALQTNRAGIPSWARREPKSGPRFMNGDTLMARITPCLENGKTGYVDFMEDGEIGLGSTEFIVLRSLPGVPSELSYFLARDSRFREHAIRNMVGSSGRQRVSAADASNYTVMAPDAEQLAAFGKEASAAFAHMKSLESESRTLAALRDTLLPQLMSGRIRVKDAEKIVEDHV
ncbi:restriction endonuclease subunit S [Streptomyces sp. NPDC059080]|uniref:restriction endonuclease subunit S n=1 Tax=Streptomyces sp. NPDC059080 TaxID=3346718 RepID=UPI00367D901B